MKLIASNKDENIEIWKRLYFFKYIRHDISYKKFHFLQKNDFLKILFLGY